MVRFSRFGDFVNVSPLVQKLCHSLYSQSPGQNARGGQHRVYLLLHDLPHVKKECTDVLVLMQVYVLRQAYILLLAEGGYLQKGVERINVG